MNYYCNCNCRPNFNYYGALPYQNYGFNNSNLQNTINTVLMCFVLLQQIDKMFSNNYNQYNGSYNTNNSFYFTPPNFDKLREYYCVKQDNFEIPKFSKIDSDLDGKINENEFKKYYIDKKAAESGKNYHKNSPELAKIKQEAENIYNAIKGDDETIGKTRYGAFLDIIDETDGVFDRKYYEKDAKALIDVIKNDPDAKFKGGRTFADIIQSRIKKGVNNQPKITDKPKTVVRLVEQKPEESIKKTDKVETPIDKTPKISEKDIEQSNKLIESAKKKAEDKDYEGAIYDYTKAIELNPNNDNAYVGRGDVKYEFEDYEGAIDDYTKALELNPKNETANFKRGEIYYDDGKYEEAIKDYTKAIELNPQNDKAYFKRGDSKFLLDNYEGAVADITKAIEINPNDYEYYSTRAQAYKILKDFDKGIEDLKKAHELYLKNPPSYSYDKNGYLGTIKEFEQLKEANKPYTERRDYDVTEVHQGGIGDCYFLAALAKHPEWIKDSDCLKWNDDGSADVFLYDSERQYDEEKQAWVYKTTSDRKTYHITKEELEQSEFQLNKENGEKEAVRINPKQDFTLRALEIGYMKACNFDYNKVVEKGGFSSRTIKMLFGEDRYKDMTYYCKPGEYSIEDLENCIQASITRNSDEDKDRNISGNTVRTQHAYTFNGYNPETNMVSISNPWDNNLADNAIEIPWDEFKNIFRIELLTQDKKSHFIPLLHKGQINLP